MEGPLKLPNGNLVTRSMIKGVLKFKGKGVVLRNEFNKFLDFITEPDDRRQAIILDVMARVLSSRHFEQPDWEAEFATAPDL